MADSEEEMLLAVVVSAAAVEEEKTPKFWDFSEIQLGYIKV